MLSKRVCMCICYLVDTTRVSLLRGCATFTPISYGRESPGAVPTLCVFAHLLGRSGRRVLLTRHSPLPLLLAVLAPEQRGRESVGVGQS